MCFGGSETLKQRNWGSIPFHHHLDHLLHIPGIHPKLLVVFFFGGGWGHLSSVKSSRGFHLGTNIEALSIHWKLNITCFNFSHIMTNEINISAIKEMWKLMIFYNILMMSCHCKHMKSWSKLSELQNEMEVFIQNHLSWVFQMYERYPGASGKYQGQMVVVNFKRLHQHDMKHLANQMWIPPNQICVPAKRDENRSVQFL